MIRKLLVLFGLIEVVAPKPILAACQRIAFKNPETAQLHARVNRLARLEGATFVWLLLRGKDRSPLLSRLLEAAGALMVIYPSPLIGVGQSFACKNPSELELQPWVAPAARLLGLLYLAVVFLSRSEPASESGS